MNDGAGLDRRTFLERVDGGIAVLVTSGLGLLHAQAAAHLYREDFNAYLVIGQNGRVTVFSGKIEMGQGAMTSQAQMVAEELGVSLAAIDMVLGDNDRCPWDISAIVGRIDMQFSTLVTPTSWRTASKAASSWNCHSA